MTVFKGKKQKYRFFSLKIFFIIPFYLSFCSGRASHIDYPSSLWTIHCIQYYYDQYNFIKNFQIQFLCFSEITIITILFCLKFWMKFFNYIFEKPAKFFNLLEKNNCRKIFLLNFCTIQEHDNIMLHKWSLVSIIHNAVINE